MNFKIINSLAQLGIYKDQWNSVDDSTPFNSWEWNYNCLKYLDQRVEPAIIALLGSDNQWIGIAPFCIEECAFQKRKLRFISAGKTRSRELNLIAQSDRFVDVADEITRLTFDSIHNHQILKGIDEIELDGFSRDESNASYYIDRMQVEGFECRTDETEDRWTLDLGSDWEMFTSKLKKPLSKKNSSAEQTLAQKNVSIRSSRSDSFDDLWRNLLQLAQRNRNSERRPCRFTEKPFAQFLYEATRSLALRDRAELMEIQYQTTPLASMLLVNDGQTAYMVHVEVDENRIELDPEYLMIVHALRASVNGGIQYFDFLRSDSRDQSNWDPSRTSLSKVHLIPDRVSARIRFYLQNSSRMLGRCVRQCAVKSR